MQKHRIILTGVSRGLGKSLLHLIIKNIPNSSIIGTVRTNKFQHQKTISTEFGPNLATIEILDLSSSQSIRKFVEVIKEKGFQFDCLINNAAVGTDNGNLVPSVEIAENTFRTNLMGTIELTEQLIPFLRQNGRIINVSSKMGGLVFHGKSVVEKFSNQKITVQDIKKQVDNYLTGCINGDLGQYDKSAYGTSKMMLNSWSRFILKNQLKNSQIAIAMSPGHCRTDMGKQSAPRSCLQGAQSIYEHINGKYKFDVFYHTNFQTDYWLC